MKVSADDLKTVAVLSRLSIPKEEEEKYSGQLDKFLSYVDNLSTLSTDGVEPTTYALPIENVFREDVVQESLDRETALQNAPLKEDGYFKVPRVLEE